MNLYRIIKLVLYWFSHYRVFYSIYFNYKYLPKHQFKRLPIVFYKKSYATISAGGKLILSEEMVANRKKLRVGYPTYDFEYQCEKTVLNICGGVLRLDGNLEIRRGGIIDIRGDVQCMDNVLFGSRCRVRIHNKAYFGSWARFTHETQIFDTNFHPMERIDKPGFYPMSRPIKVGSFCWVGNRTTIGPGTVLPDYTTVASNSLLNKDYSFIKPYSIVGGIPAKLLREGYVRVWDKKRELEYQKKEFSWYESWYNQFSKI